MFLYHFLKHSYETTGSSRNYKIIDLERGKGIVYIQVTLGASSGVVFVP